MNKLMDFFKSQDSEETGTEKYEMGKTRKNPMRMDGLGGTVNA